MLLIISPAKSLELHKEISFLESSIPVFQNEIEPISKVLKKMKVAKIKKTFDLSDKLAALNFERYQNLGTIESIQQSRQALFTFNGEVYTGLDAYSMPKETVHKAQTHLRILSGLYGVLKPLDLIEPYRLEMGSTIGWGKYKSLYDYWKSKVTVFLKEEIEHFEEKKLINLASIEYASVIDRKKLGFPVLDIEFLEDKGIKLQNISFFSKKARGLMARFILENNIINAKDIQDFSETGYLYSKELSTEEKSVFVRKAK